MMSSVGFAAGGKGCTFHTMHRRINGSSGVARTWSVGRRSYTRPQTVPNSASFGENVGYGGIHKNTICTFKKKMCTRTKYTCPHTEDVP